MDNSPQFLTLEYFNQMLIEIFKNYFQNYQNFRLYFFLFWLILTISILISLIKQTYQIFSTLTFALQYSFNGVLNFVKGFFTSPFFLIGYILKSVFKLVCFIIKLPLTLPAFIISLKIKILVYAVFLIFYIVYSFLLYILM